MEPLGHIHFLTIHCSGSPANRGDTAAIVCGWDKAKYGQNSYHWVVAEDGTKTRCLPDTVKGAHVRLQNTGNIGVCYIGGVKEGVKTTGYVSNPNNCADTRTPEQKKALREIVADYKRDHPGLVVRGHRDWPGVHKLCPCFDVASAL